MTDSITHTIDTINQLKADSVLLSDSIHQVDSLARLDSIKIAANIPSGFEGIQHPSIPATESWVFIILTALFLLLVFGIVRSAGEFIQSFKTFFSKREPVNFLPSPTVNIVQFQISITVFTISILALTIDEMYFDLSGQFNFWIFALLFGVTAAFYILKHMLFNIVGYTFFNGKITREYKSTYFSLLNGFTVLIFPILVLYTFQSVNWHQTLAIITVCMIVIFYILLIIKIFHIFYSKPLDLFYIFLYLCTLEIIPVLVLFRVYNLIV